MSSRARDQSPKKILLVAWFLEGERTWLEDGLRSKGYEVRSIGFGRPTPCARSHMGPIEFLGLFWLALRARWESFFFGADAVVTAFPAMAIAFGLVKKLSFGKERHLAWYYNSSHPYRGWKRRLARFALKATESFVVFSRAERAVYAEVLDRDPADFYFTPLTQELPLRPRLEETLARLQLPSKYLASLGSSGRDFDSLFEVARNSHLPVVLVTHPHCLEGREIPENVWVRTSLDQGDYLNVLEGAEALVLPLANDKTACGQMTVVQARRLGVPVLTTRCVGTVDYVHDGVDGRLLEVGDTKAWVEVVRKVNSDPRRLEIWSQNASRSASILDARRDPETLARWFEAKGERGWG